MFKLINKPWEFRKLVRAYRISYYRRRRCDAEHIAWAQALIGRRAVNDDR